MARSLVSIPLRRIRGGSLTIIEGGERQTFGSGAPAAVLTIRSPQAWSNLLRGSLGMADAYTDGLWDSPDLVALIRLAARNAALMDRFRSHLAPLLAPLQRLRALPRWSSRRRRRCDISAHYDLGEELFERMLDPTLTYSCALFPRPQTTLEEAQITKLELVCEKLELAPGDRVLEIGTGWGSFALHAAATRGCEVTTTTISERQHEYAVDRVRQAGLEERVSVLKADYRDLRGYFDKLVSIEMIEAVGWRHTATFFATCSNLLEPDGAMLLQAITIDDRAYEAEKDSRSFIKERIFPGGSLPSLESITRDLAKRTDLQVIGLEDLTAHYVPTLRLWRDNLAANATALAQLGYDERFRRLWTLYLAYCEGGFAERRICDVQLLLTKPRARLRSLGHARGARPLRRRTWAFAGELDSVIRDFKAFLFRGNVVDLAVAVVMGAAFGALVTALVRDLLTPIVALIFGKPNFSNLSFTINGSHFLYGDFLNYLFAFVSIAAAVFFFVVQPLNALMRRQKAHPDADADTRPCTECMSEIPREARRCAFCTSAQEPAPATG